MSNHKNLLFFNKEGDYLNFNYNYTTDRFEGDLLFHENSSDTFKTLGIYMLENIPSFEFELPGTLTLNKFQLFNEYGLFFYNSKYENQSISRIEPINNDPTFYSKYIFGDNFEKKFPIGSIIRFDSVFLEFNNPTQTYTVVSTKKGAIMIISSVDNATFESMYISQYSDQSIYVGRTISAINGIGVYNYIDGLYSDNLSYWNEPQFYDKLYKKKKLNVINSQFNDGIYTVKEEELTDNKHFEYYTSGMNGEDIIIEVVSKTDLPRIYDGGLNINQVSNQITSGGEILTFSYTSNVGADGTYTSLTSNGASSSVTGTGGLFNVIVSGGVVSSVTLNKIGKQYTVGDLFVIDGVSIGGSTLTDDVYITINSVADPIVSVENKIYFSSSVPDILKPGREFKIIGSTTNQNFFTIANIPTFIGNTQETFYGTQSQVLWNNKIYQCILAYTQSFTGATQFVDPYTTEYWSPFISYIKVDQIVTPEILLGAQIYLTTDRIYFGYGFTYSTAATLASAAEKYKDDLKSFNIDLFYENNKLKADLIYPSKYAEVNFYQNQIGPTYSIGNVTQTYERVTQVEESVNPELNYDISQNILVNIVFTDIDEYGFKIIINGQVYQEQLEAIYSGGLLDMQRTIDRTLRNWLARYYTELIRLGIISDIQYTGPIFSPFVNSIKLQTQYPNVPLLIDDIFIGITADYHIEHSRVLFSNNDYTNTRPTIGPVLTLTINDDEFTQNTIYQTGSYSQYPDIPATLSAWVDEHGDYLRTFGILVTPINNLLKFDVKRLDRRLDYTINTGKLSIPGIIDYTITKKIKGNDGLLITSNEVSLPTNNLTSFEDAGFATGMVFSINNTIHPYNNQEYVIQFLDPQVLNLSYQGPFWGLTSGICNSSAFITLAFDTGYGQTACNGPIVGPTPSGAGPYQIGAFDPSAFTLTYNPNTYALNTYNLQGYPGTSGLVDLIYVQLSNSIYAFGDDLTVMDSYITSYLTTVSLPGNTQSIEIEYNSYNNYLYCLSKNHIFVVDPLLNTLVATMSLTNNAHDMEINPNNGDIYVTYDNSPNIDIYDYTNTLAVTLGTSSLNFPPSATSCGKMVFNEFEGDMYVITDVSQTLRINGGPSLPGYLPLNSSNPNRTIQTTYGIPGLTNSIFYEPINEAIYVYGSSSLWKIDNGISQSISGITTQPFNDIIFNNLTGEMNISDSSTSFKSLNLSTDTITINTGVSNYGYLALNQFDGDVYLSSLSSNSVSVIRPTTGAVVQTISLPAGSTRIIYNPDRRSVWVIEPSSNTIMEIEVTLNSTININPSVYNPINDNSYGTLDPNYEPHVDLWLKTKEYVRRPRENFEGEVQVKYYWKWFADDVPEFFMYDFSGDQLPINGSYSYTGTKPLSPVVLNKNANKDLTKLNSPEYQQTIFNKVEYKLSYIDDESNISIEPEPIQLFVGYKSEEEGALRSVLQLWKKEEVTIEFESTQINGTILKFETLDQFGPDKRAMISINTLSSEFFIGKGLKEGQLITIYVRDLTNKSSQYISNNNGLIMKIRTVYAKNMVLDFLSGNDLLYSESTVIVDYPKVNNTTYLKTTIKVIDREISRFVVYGQTEVEDERFKIELGNVGKLIAPNEVFIFKEYDILEGGTDWTILNKKRKEMLMMKHLIYPYIGAYKSIINAINFFGYNDLQLNEYYRDINPNSEKFLKLFKVEIPDMFDNTIEGFTESEFVKNNFPNENYEETNMFNLTYQITDKEGTNVLNYSIDEVVIKLQGLKYWLKRNIIPLTHKIMDITGKAYLKSTNEIVHTTYDVRFINSKENMTPITFRLNEAYLMPINSGSTVYNCVLDFYTIIEGIGSDKNPTGLVPPPKPFNGVDLEIPDYFNISIRTYKTYKEWAPFKTYSIGDKITYYDKLYESAKDNNKINNPRKYENTKSWVPNTSYEVTNVVEYNRDIYVCTGLGTFATSSGTSSITTSVPPVLDNGSDKNWLNITQWREIDLEPVQTLSEFRKVPKNSEMNPILPYNFTIDSNIDPFVVIEVTSDNGYGLIYRDRKNYEIRGNKDLTEPTKYIDPIGPFIPISQIY